MWRILNLTMALLTLFGHAFSNKSSKKQIISIDLFARWKYNVICKTIRYRAYYTLFAGHRKTIWFGAACNGKFCVETEEEEE